MGRSTENIAWHSLSTQGSPSHISFLLPPSFPLLPFLFDSQLNPPKSVTIQTCQETNSNVCLELEASLSLSLSRGSAWHGSRKKEKEEEGSVSVRSSENFISLNLVWRFTTCLLVMTFQE